MHFRKLEVTGFKTFADKVELVFEPGTTAVVGPNGCGKSNICDAIKWALGEQSSKSLRCEKMEDLIFSGGSERRPLGMAQVTLTVSNSDSILPTDYSEMEIGRRLFRSGESEYYMNKNQCLLKDIQEMFMDTGLGMSSYSLMEQGHIDLILNSSPQERRLILEEAAGITKFRHRKRISLKKLEATEQNLLRVDDILYELEKQVSSLRRQAAKARRYQDYHNELKELDTQLSYHRYASLIREFENTQNKITGSDDKMQSISASIKKLEAELEVHRLEITKSEEKLVELRAQERKAQKKVEETESEIAVLKERRVNLQQRQQRSMAELGKLQEQLQELEKQIAAISVEKGKLGESISSQEEELKLAQEKADRLSESTSMAEKKVEEFKSQTIELLNRKAKAQNELSATDGRLDYLVTRLDRLAASTENFQNERTQLENKLTQLQEEVEAGEGEIRELEAKQKQVGTEIGQLQSKIALLDKNIREVEQNKGNRSSRLQSLKELQAAYEGYDAGVKAILGKSGKQKEAAQSPKGIFGVVAEIITTEPRYEPAIEASLGSSIQDIVTETMEDARTAVEFLKERKSGRATLWPMDILSQSAGEFSPNDPLPDGVLAVAAQVVNFDEKYSLLVQHLLGNTMIVDDLDTAVRLAGSVSKPVTIKFATLDGQVVSSAGMMTGGTGPKGAGLLRRSREISDLGKEVAELDKQLADLAGERDGIVSEASVRQRERENIARDIQRKQISHTGAKKDLSQYEQRLARLDKEISVVESECDSLEKEIVTLEENKARLSANAQELEKQSAEVNQKINALQMEMKSKVQQRDAMVQQCTNIKVQLASKKQQEQGVAERLKSLERERERLAGSLSSSKESASSDGEAEKELAEKISSQTKLLEELFRERSKIEEELSKLETQRQGSQNALSQGETSLRENRRDMDLLNKEKYQFEIAKTQIQMNIDSLISKMRERYGVSLEELQNQNSENADDGQKQDSEPSEDEITGRIEELRDRMTKMGTVNLTAVDEYNRQKERYDLLVTQKEDLLKAKDSLYNIIQRINRESRERLRETFDSVNVNFQELFKRLFGGGHAELAMIGEEDVLESGVDIVARPPGKKPQSISLLSSGERSLTAIALLFALFKIKPSPFCVLDEVDAALDDANVGRFTDMVKEFSENIQFIIITHNKRTMAIADVLYGITMEELGVSRLISMKMGSSSKVDQKAS